MLVGLLLAGVAPATSAAGLAHSGRPVDAGGSQTWDLAADMAAHPSQNPAPDSHGHDGVWSFSESANGADDPTTYSPLTVDSVTSCNDGTAGHDETWTPGDWAPIVGLLGCNGRQAYVHPNAAEAAVVTWTSPVSGTVTVAGSLTSADPGGGDGVGYDLYDNTTTLTSGELPDASSTSATKTLQVSVGDKVSLQVDAGPAGNTDYDTTNVDFTISTPEPTVSTTTTLSGTPMLDGVDDPVTYTAQVTPAAATGTVGFTDSGQPVAGCDAVALSQQGVATCTTTYHSAGSHLVTASYSGDATYQPSSSAPSLVRAAYLFLPQSASCATPVDCVVIGGVSAKDDNSRPRTFSATLRSGSWSADFSVGKDIDDLRDVSCPSRDACVAVGWRPTSDGSQALIGHWSPKGWSVKALGAIDRAQAQTLSAVSCPSEKSCFAVGTWQKKAGSKASSQQTLVEQLKDGRWKGARIDNPSDADGVAPGAISCPSSKSCVYVGEEYRQSSPPRALPLVGRFADGTWKKPLVLRVSHTHEANLSGVECPADGTCMAAGTTVDTSGATYLDRPLTAALTKGRWKVKEIGPTSATPGSEGINDIACPKPTDCTAVGYYWNDAADAKLPLVMSWDGSTWTEDRNVAIPPQAGSDTVRGELTTVSCAGRYSCVASGDIAAANDAQNVQSGVDGLIESGSGSSWSVQ